MKNSARPKLYRALEMLPGLATWTTFIGGAVLSYYQPAWVAVFIIIFDLYFFFMAFNVLFHLLHAYRILEIHKSQDWLQRCKDLIDTKNLLEKLRELRLQSKDRRVAEVFEQEIEKISELAARGAVIDYKKILHVVLLPMVSEPYEVIKSSVDSYFQSRYPKESMILVLATEERAGQSTSLAAEKIASEYSGKFRKVLVTKHPDAVPGEARVKGANITYAARQAKKLVDEIGLDYKDVIVSAFDADTVVGQDYFAKLTYVYLTEKSPTRASYQPTPLFHNNVWDTPSVNRISAASNSFWQMIESSRPDRLITFSSHSMSLQTLVDVDFWPVDVIPDDSRIFWKCFLHYNGDYRVVPLQLAVSLDAVSLPSYTDSLVGQYKQYRRWAWGVIDFAYITYGFIKNRRIPLWKKFLNSYRLFVAHYLWANAAVLIAVLGWLPLILGGDRFGNEVFALNLPAITRLILTLAMSFLIVSVVLNYLLLPNRPKRRSRTSSLGMILQWLLVPVVSIFIHALPAIDAQTRLLFGRYMEFWVTPKHRKSQP